MCDFLQLTGVESSKNPSTPLMLAFFSKKWQNIPMNDQNYLRILRRIAKEEGYKITRVIDGVFELKKSNKCRYIKGRDFGLNSALSNQMSANKAITFEVLNRNKIKAVPHYEIYHPTYYAMFGNQKKRNNERMKMIIEKEGLPVVVKPAEGSSGRNVEVAKNKREMQRLSKEIFKEEKGVVFSPFRVIDHEYRVVMLNGKAELIFDKIRGKDEFKHNLCLGAKAETLKKTDKKAKKLETIAKRAVKTLGLTFASVDIIETKEFGLEVLEVNSGVSMGYYSIQSKQNFLLAKSIYKKAFKKALKK